MPARQKIMDTCICFFFLVFFPKVWPALERTVLHCLTSFRIAKSLPVMDSSFEIMNNDGLWSCFFLRTNRHVQSCLVTHHSGISMKWFFRECEHTLVWQQAAKAFHKHRWMLQCEDCSIKHRPQYFEAVVFSTGCFAVEQPLYRKHLKKYNIQFRKFVRRIVERPPATNWSAQWHDILHEGNMRVITGPVPVEFYAGQKGAWLNTGISLLTLQI